MLSEGKMKNLAFGTFVLLFLFSYLISAEETTATTDEKPTEQKKKAVVVTYDADNPQVSEFIPIGVLSYDTIKEFCSPMLSKTGTMGYMPEKECVVVFDYKKNAAKIREFIESATAQIPDYSNVNIKVEVSYQGVYGGGSLGLGGKVSYGGGQNNQLIIRDGKVMKPKSVTVRAFDNSTRGSSNTTQFIVTRSGRPASIWAGKTIVDPSWLNNYKFRPLVIINNKNSTVIIPGETPDFVWTNVGAYLYILPKYLGDGLIDVEVFPVVSYLDGKGKKQAVRVESVSTRVTVKSGFKINIGGIVKGKNDFYSSFFGPNFIGEDNNTNLLDMYLTATVIERPSPPPDRLR